MKADATFNFTYEVQSCKGRAAAGLNVEHLNRSLSPSKGGKGCFTAVFKWRANARVKATMTKRNLVWEGTADTIIIRRVDVLKVHDYARANCCLRDYLFIRLPLKIGLRTGEICTLRIEDIDFEDRSFIVLDSKKHKTFPLPLDGLTLQFMKDLVGDCAEGFVFKRKKAWKRKLVETPLTVQAVWTRVHDIAASAGVKKFNPRMLRHYFAADWAVVQKKNIEVLRRILRHKDLWVTHSYLARLVFFEDVQREYDRLQHYPIEKKIGGGMFRKMEQGMSVELRESGFYRSFCINCVHEKTCRYVDEAAVNPWAKGCKYFIPKIARGGEPC